MATIRVLSESVANKIAAGEVVERPASVVKELVENAIDAEATRISVEVHGQGCRSVRVVDNGIGMEADDALLALERHATSKIFTEDDLLAICSLGFRGEALPSIASVSRIELLTRTREATAGTRIRADGGMVQEVAQCGCPPGTQVWMRELFYNQPARRKFLKGEQTEFGQVVDVLIRSALARFQIHFSLRRGNRLVHDWPTAANVQQRLSQIFPAGLPQSWLPLASVYGALQVGGFLSPPEVHRSNSRMFFLYVNGRPVRDRLLSLAVMEAYRSLLPRGRFPLGVLFVELPAEQVDVNVHPGKVEVRFQDATALSRRVTRAVRDALKAMEERRWSRPLGATGKRYTGAERVQGRLEPLPGQDQMVAERGPTTYGTSSEATTGEAAGEKGEGRAGDEAQESWALFGELKVIGQLHRSYILGEAGDGLLLIDQHAAHERVLFETFQTQVASVSMASQELMVPETLEVTGAEGAWLEKVLPLFDRLGFSVEPFGSQTFVVRSIPAVALREEPLTLLRDLVAEGCRRGIDPDPQVMLEKLLQALACKLAIKAGQRLHIEEMAALLKQLDALNYSSTCPHGRPLWWKLTLEEMERFFGRA